MRLSFVTGLALLSLSAAAVAQTKYCIGGELDTLSVAQINVCKAKSASLRKEAKLLGTPGNWHFVVICDEAGWNDYASFTGNSRKALLNAAENTDAELRFTFVRASRIESDDARGLDLVLASARKNMPGVGLRKIPATEPIRGGANLLMASGGAPEEDSR